MAELSRRELRELTKLINSTLLRCKVQLEIIESFPEPERENTLLIALFHADQALEAATLSGPPDLQAKAEMFRGHCYRRLGRWKDAHRSYVRAASVPAFAADRGSEGLEALTAKCLRRAAKEKELAAFKDGTSQDPLEVDEISQIIDLYARIPDDDCAEQFGNGVAETQSRESKGRGGEGAAANKAVSQPRRLVRDGNGNIISTPNDAPSLRSVKYQRT